MALLQKKSAQRFPYRFKMEKPLSHQQCYPQREPESIFPKENPLIYLDLSIISQGKYLCGHFTGNKLHLLHFNCYSKCCFSIFIYTVFIWICAPLVYGRFFHGRYITWTGNTNRFTDNRYSIFAALKSR